MFLNNAGINGGGIAMYGKSNVLFNQHNLLHKQSYFTMEVDFLLATTTPIGFLFFDVGLPAKVICQKYCHGWISFLRSHLQTCMTYTIASVFNYRQSTWSVSFLQIQSKFAVY